MQCHDVSTKNNSADIVSHSCCPTKIGDSNLWWKWLPWLPKDESDWPKAKNIYCQVDEASLEARTIIISDVMKCLTHLWGIKYCINTCRGSFKLTTFNSFILISLRLVRPHSRTLSYWWRAKFVTSPHERDVPTNQLSKWQRVVQFTQQLWTWWTRDYLKQLQKWTKWMTSDGPKYGVGIVVLICDDNAPQLK